MTALLSDSELLRRLIGFDSTSSGSILPIADFISEYLDREGIHAFRVGRADPDKVNLTFRLGPEAGSDRKGLVLSGHMDVVPATEQGWKSNPFELVDSGDRFIGRGTADMKGFLALAINAAAKTEVSRLRRPLFLIFTYDEEVGTLGAKEFVEEWPKDRPLPKWTVIGEPTSLRTIRMHKGHLKARITLSGTTAHSGYPHLGVNAIEKAGQVLSVLSELRQSLEGERSPHSRSFTDVPWVTLNVGTIQGGTAVNIVPDRCTLDVGLRLLPAMSSSEMMDRLESAVTTAGGGQVEMISNSPPMLLDADHPLIQTLSSFPGAAIGESVNFASDGGWFQSLGLECVLFCPGSIEVAHRPNEHLPKSEFSRVAGILPPLIERCCM